MTTVNPTELEEALRREMANLEGERTILISLLSVIFPSCMSHHEADESGIENYWGWVVYMDIPTGQVSFKVGDDADSCTWFSHIKRVASPWDKHEKEEMILRIADFINTYDPGGKISGGRKE